MITIAENAEIGGKKLSSTCQRGGIVLERIDGWRADV